MQLKRHAEIIVTEHILSMAFAVLMKSNKKQITLLGHLNLVLNLCLNTFSENYYGVLSFEYITYIIYNIFADQP